MKSFEQWLIEAQKQPVISGYFLRYNLRTNPGRTVSQNLETPLYKTYYEALKQKKEFSRVNVPSIILIRFADGTSRHVNNDAWHFNRVGNLVHDYQVEKNGRGKTNHSYLIKNDHNYKIISAIDKLRGELRSGFMPRNTGEQVPESFWQDVNAALDSAAKEENLNTVLELYDYIQEKYDSEQEAVEVCLDIIKQTLNKFGYEVG